METRNKFYGGLKMENNMRIEQELIFLLESLGKTRINQKDLDYCFSEMIKRRQHASAVYSFGLNGEVKDDKII